MVTIRAARIRRRSGVRVFYVGSFSTPTLEYAVQRVRVAGQRRWACACPGFFHFWSIHRRHCKHILLVRWWLATRGGLRYARGGSVAHVEVPQPELGFGREGG